MKHKFSFIALAFIAATTLVGCNPESMAGNSAVKCYEDVYANNVDKLINKIYVPPCVSDSMFSLYKEELRKKVNTMYHEAESCNGIKSIKCIRSLDAGQAYGVKTDLVTLHIIYQNNKETSAKVNMYHVGDDWLIGM